MRRRLPAIGVGILAWSRPEVFGASLVSEFGVCAIVARGVAIVAAIQKTRDRAIHLFEGILSVAVGNADLPLSRSSWGRDRVRHWSLGRRQWRSQLVPNVRLREAIADEWLLGLRGILSIILGAILILRPQFGQVTTTYVAGTYGLIFGVVLVVLRLSLRRLNMGYDRLG